MEYCESAMRTYDSLMSIGKLIREYRHVLDDSDLNEIEDILEKAFEKSENVVAKRLKETSDGLKKKLGIE